MQTVAVAGLHVRPLTPEQTASVLASGRLTLVADNRELIHYHGRDDDGDFALIQGHNSGAGFMVRT